MSSAKIPALLVLLLELGSPRLLPLLNQGMVIGGEGHHSRVLALAEALRGKRTLGARRLVESRVRSTEGIAFVLELEAVAGLSCWTRGTAGVEVDAELLRLEASRCPWFRWGPVELGPMVVP